MPQGHNRKTERNAEVMRLWGQGWSQGRIAKHLGISQPRVGMIQENELFKAEHECYRRRRHVDR